MQLASLQKLTVHTTLIYVHPLTCMNTSCRSSLVLIRRLLLATAGYTDTTSTAVSYCSHNVPYNNILYKLMFSKNLEHWLRICKIAGSEVCTCIHFSIKVSDNEGKISQQSVYNFKSQNLTMCDSCQIALMFVIIS